MTDPDSPRSGAARDETPHAGAPAGDAQLDDATLARLRPLAFTVAYRMLGSVAEAEDVAQEALTRVAQADGVRNPDAFITTVTTRMAIDVLRSARVRRESYVGDWLPEPLVGPVPSVPVAMAAPPSDAAAHAELADDLSTAFLVLLETLTPTERAAFLLHDVLGFSHGDAADVIGTSVVGARQLASRARRRIARHRGDVGEGEALDGASASAEARGASANRAAGNNTVGSSTADNTAGNNAAGNRATGNRAAEDHAATSDTAANSAAATSAVAHDAAANDAVANDAVANDAVANGAADDDGAADGTRTGVSSARTTSRRPPQVGRSRGAVGRPRGAEDKARAEELVARFLAACEEGEVDPFLELLTQDVVFTGDGGGKTPRGMAISRAVSGRESVSRLLASFARRGLPVRFERALIGGEPGLVVVADDVVGGGVLGTLAFEVSGGRISAVQSVVNPEKLGHVGPLADLDRLEAWWKNARKGRAAR